jgi:hypothetical protein
LVKAGVAREATRGVGVAPVMWVPQMELSIVDKADKVATQEARGGIWGMGAEEVIVSKYGEGAISFDFGNEYVALFLYATFGSLSSASFNGAYKHTLSLQNDNAHDSLTLTAVDEVEQAQWERVMIDSWTLECEVGSLPKSSFELVSNPSTDTSGHSPSFTTPVNYLFGHQDVKLKLATDTSGLDAASRLPIKKVSITVSKNTVKNNVCGTLQPKDILNQQFIIEGEFELDYESTTYKDLMMDESYRALRLELVNSDVTIGSTNPAFRIDLSRVAFSEWEEERPLDELVNQKIKFSAMYDPTNGDVVHDCYLVNNTASYA